MMRETLDCRPLSEMRMCINSYLRSIANQCRNRTDELRLLIGLLDMRRTAAEIRE